MSAKDFMKKVLANIGGTPPREESQPDSIPMRDTTPTQDTVMNMGEDTVMDMGEKEHIGEAEDRNEDKEISENGDIGEKGEDNPQSQSKAYAKVLPMPPSIYESMTERTTETYSPEVLRQKLNRLEVGRDEYLG